MIRQLNLIISFLLFYQVAFSDCRTVRESIGRNFKHQETLKNYRNKLASIHDALSSGSVESDVSGGGRPSYRIDLGEDLIWSSRTALEAESFRAAAVSSDSLEYSHEASNPEEKEVETTTLFPVQNLINSQNTQWLKSDLMDDDDDMEEEEDDLLDDGCDEGDIMKVSCNSCVCINSKYICSKRDCGDAEIPAPPKLKAPGKKKNTFNYNKKTDPAAVDDSGNVLYGEYFSSEADFASVAVGNDTIVRDDEPAEFSCIDGRTKPVDCNQCICALGRWACTKMSCIPMSLREKASFHGAEFIKKADTLKENMGIDDDCMEGDTKKSDCNQCVCHENSWACTDFECPSKAPPTKPNQTIKLEACQTEEDVKSVECNICSCRSGIWRCTTNDCKKFGDKYYQPIHRTPQKTTSSVLTLDSDSAENHSYL